MGHYYQGERRSTEVNQYIGRGVKGEGAELVFGSRLRGSRRQPIKWKRIGWKTCEPCHYHLAWRMTKSGASFVHSPLHICTATFFTHKTDLEPTFLCNYSPLIGTRISQVSEI